MDFHLLEAKKPRSILKQQLKGEFVGQDPSKIPGQRENTLAWRRRVVKIFVELGLGRQVSYDKYLNRDKVYDPYAAYRRQIFDIFTQMEKTNGKDFMDALTDEQLKTSIRTLAKNISLIRDIPNKDPKLSSITTGNYGGNLTHRAGYVDKDGTTILGMPHSSDHLERATATVDKPGQLSMSKLKTHDNPSIKLIHRALDQDKFDHEKDSAAVFSLDNKPFYLLGHVTKTVKFGEQVGGQYNLYIPRALYNLSRTNNLGERVTKDVLSIRDTKDYTWFTKWHRLWSGQELAKLRNNGQEVVIKGSNFEKVIDEAQQLAWEKSKPFFIHQAAYIIAAHQGAPKEKLQQFMQKIKQLGEEFSWYVWLVANEYQFGIRVPDRQKLNPGRPTTANSTQPKIENSTIQPTGREDTSSWNLGDLKGLGFTTPNIGEFERKLRMSKYNLAYQGNKATTHLWIPLVDLERYTATFGLKLLPTDISDYLKNSRKLSKTQYIVGTEGGNIEVKPNLPFPQFIFNQGGKEFALVPAVEYLRHFDSPAHGGERLVHGKGILPGKMPKRAYYDARFLRAHPNFVPQREVYVYDPDKRRQTPPVAKEPTEVIPGRSTSIPNFRIRSRGRGVQWSAPKGKQDKKNE